MSGPQSPPKALLFDIGGVCVLSPFQAILDYELQNGIPPGWINTAISASKPNGAWHRLERGEMKLDKHFYEQFGKDLRNQPLWAKHIQRARTNANGSKWADEQPVPRIDVEWLIEAILRISRRPDPHMYPALRKLKASGRFLLAALSNTMPLPEEHIANQAHEEGDVRSVFDPFVSSAHCGIRKPEPRAYELAMELMRAKWHETSRTEDLTPSDIVFIDDIGENLRAGRAFGFRTIKVKLGDTPQAIRELEAITGMALLAETKL